MKKPLRLNKFFTQITFTLFLSIAAGFSAKAQMVGIVIPEAVFNNNSDVLFGKAKISADGKIIAGSYQSNPDNRFFIINDGVFTTSSDELLSVYNISYDGSTIVGSDSPAPDPSVNGFYYKNNQAFILPRVNDEFSEIYDSSANGAIMVGARGNKAIKIENDVITELPTIDQTSSPIASAISADGSVIAGYVFNTDLEKGAIFKYVDGQMINLGFATFNNVAYGSDVRAISYDGKVITGAYDIENFDRGSFKHDDINGFVDLGNLGENSTTAIDISATGKIIVGHSRNTANHTRAFKHTDAAGIIDLGTLGGDNAMATSITPDGSVIVGLSETGNGDEIQIFVLRNQAEDEIPSEDAPSEEDAPSLVSVDNTLKVLNQNANQLNSILNLKENLLNFSLNQDAKLFGKNNMHFAMGARLNSVDKSQEVGGNFKFAYRFNENFRAGIFADYGFNSNLPNNFRANNSIPNSTIFSTISANADDSALFLKLAASFGASDLDITRQTLENTEAGKGRANLSTKGAMAQVGYGFNFANRLKITPYLGVRFSEILRKSYRETSGATFPISFQEARKKSTTALFGGNVEWQISQNLNSRFGFGFEKDLSVSLDGYRGNISYLGYFDLTPRKIRENRYVASGGLTYKITQLQELSLDLQYGKQSLQSSNALIGYVNYAIGF